MFTQEAHHAGPRAAFPSSRRAGALLATLIFVASVVIGSLSTAAAAPGDSASFGSGGVSALPNSDSTLVAAAVQSDGKLVAVGEQGRKSGHVRILVARFTTGGALDKSFSGDGIALGAEGTTATDVAIQSGGKIVLSGIATNAAGQTSSGMLAMRLNANGSSDNSFSGNGVVTTLAARGGQARAVALDGSKIVLAGGATLGASSDGFDRLAVARLNANGSPDNSFGSGGSKVLDFGRLSYANTVAIDGSGRIVLAGSQRNDLQTTSVLAARLRSNGSPDPSFNGSGLFLKQYAKSAAFSAAFDLAVEPGGKVDLAGSATNGSSDPEGADAIVIRLGGNGTPDNSFGAGGVTYLPATSDKDQYTKTDPLPGAQGIVLSGSSIVVAGYFDDLTLKRGSLWALQSNGSPVTSFGSNGRVDKVGSGGANVNFRGIAARATGSLYAVGQQMVGLSAPQGIAAGFEGFAGGGTSPGGNAPKCFGRPATIVGTAKSEKIVGTRGRDVIVGFGGRDRIIGGNGNDLICGHRGNDSITAGGGRDLVSGGPGNDTLVTKGGNDRIVGNSGNDRIFAGPGRDRAAAGPGRDRVFGGGGGDVLYGNSGPDLIFGNQGNDRLFGNQGNDRLFGNQGRDRAIGGAGRDLTRP